MIHATIQAAEALAGFSRRSERAANLAPPMRVIVQGVRQDTLYNFAQGGVYPQAWEPSERVKARGGKTLIDTALLKNSIHGRVAGDTGYVGTSVLYARIHQLGGKAGRGAVIPARPFLPVKDGRLSPARAAKNRRIVSNWIVNGSPTP